MDTETGGQVCIRVISQEISTVLVEVFSEALFTRHCFHTKWKYLNFLVLTQQWNENEVRSGEDAGPETTQWPRPARCAPHPPKTAKHSRRVVSQRLVLWSV